MENCTYQAKSVHYQHYQWHIQLVIYSEESENSNRNSSKIPYGTKANTQLFRLDDYRTSASIPYPL